MYTAVCLECLVRLACASDTLLPCAHLIAGDFQTGEWDTDAAENVAYDNKTNRAFVASAESGVLKVIDVTNPTLLTEAGTLNVGANLATYCNEVDCIYEDVDFGRDNGCGYAKMTKYITNYGTLDLNAGVTYGPSGNFSMVPYVYGGGSANTWAVDSTMTSPEACRSLCSNVLGTSHFSYEYEGSRRSQTARTSVLRRATSRPTSRRTGTSPSRSATTTTRTGRSALTCPRGGLDVEGRRRPISCGKFQAESVQSVAVIHVDGYANRSWPRPRRPSTPSPRATSPSTTRTR